MNAYIPKPCNQEVEKYLNTWNSNEKYTSQESSLNKIFIEIFPKNTKIEDILIKASALNSFYSTNIFSIFTVAKHILRLDIDERLKQGDPSLISEIANVEINGKRKNFYSFATKYCSHHNQEDFPIYDSYVDKVLMYFKKVDKFTAFNQSELKEYTRYKEILLEFAKFYGITSYGPKYLDMYLWQLGKEIIELKSIMKKFVASGWDLISVPAKQWLDEKSDKDTLIAAIKQADKECGSCGCDLDPLYKRALELIK